MKARRIRRAPNETSPQTTRFNVSERIPLSPPRPGPTTVAPLLINARNLDILHAAGKYSVAWKEKLLRRPRFDGSSAAEDMPCQAMSGK
jgi:hypothetical protein